MRNPLFHALTTDQQHAALEAVAQWHDKLARQCSEIAKDEPRLSEETRSRARQAANHHAASATAIRNLDPKKL